MPELPEVETTCRGIRPHLLGQEICQAIIRQGQLRWPIPAHLKRTLIGQTITDISRRGKYLLFELPKGWLICHLGMSGSLRLLKRKLAAKKHDHVDIICKNGTILRYHDPRRFGCLLWTDTSPEQHPLLARLGPEPLERGFNATYLHQRAKKSQQAIKAFIMNAQIVVGVGNIYASEALFIAGIHPQRCAARISRERYQLLTQAIKQVLQRAIRAGGTTLKDFHAADGKPGYFHQQLHVYGREQQPCHNCQQPLKLTRIGQRSSVYCSSCQR